MYDCHLFYIDKGNYKKRKIKGHTLHVRRKLKKNRGKMKKSKASIIKRHYSISLGPFVNLELELVSKRRIAPIVEGKQRKERIKQGRLGSNDFRGNT